MSHSAGTRGVEGGCGLELGLRLGLGLGSPPLSSFPLLCAKEGRAHHEVVVAIPDSEALSSGVVLEPGLLGGPTRDPSVLPPLLPLPLCPMWEVLLMFEGCELELGYNCHQISFVAP